MKPPRYLVAGLFALAFGAGYAIERLPIEDFSRDPSAARARLSPDGKRLAYLHEYKGRTTLHIAKANTRS